MRIEFNRTGAERKALVTAIAEILATKPKYMGMPTAAYDFGGLIIDKSGALEFEDNVFPKDIHDLLYQLAERGFTAAEMPDTAADSEGKEPCEELSEETDTEPQGESVGCGLPVATSCEARSTDRVGRRDLTVSLPLETVAVENLTRLLEVKGQLIQKALGITELPIEVTEDAVSFPWFDTIPDADTAKAYTDFIAALCRMSKEQKRINSTEKEVTNEKYAFRCFLLRLGFIGAEYKADRKILLKNLTGSSAFKTTKEVAADEISE